MSDLIYMSKEGIRKLTDQLKQLKFKERPVIIAEIKRTRELGDLSENAEYHAAKESQIYLERKISELEFTLSRVQPIDVDSIPSDKVYLFAKVLVKDQDSGEEIEYTIAPADESDVYNDIISVKSPIGAGLLGKGVGEIAAIEIPAGKLKYKILKISRD